MTDANITQILIPWLAFIAVALMALVGVILALMADGRRQKAAERRPEP